MIRLAMSLFSFACLLPASAALGCSPANLEPSKSEIRALAQKAYESASIIADVEVIASGDDAGNGAVLRSLKVWKGVHKNLFVMQTETTCDIGLWQKGNRLRIVLDGGSIFFSASQSKNGLLLDDRAEFEHELDKLIGRARPRHFRQPNTMYDR
ncbi:hypothetical protein [Novosphingobium sp. P6W]|uniref:hypothetical protein n=1 Tax=Novosphingobium sp. P6W TaxID=1609758 RepID=UPI0013B4237D|nr:hypothetical protein [Novosphingobium sp. P6W]